MTPLCLSLQTAEETLELGRILASIFLCAPAKPALLLQGELGAGKTTLVRGLVEALPGAELADVSSPSFNIFNIYPTTPQVAHFDLYRLEGLPPDEALFECLGNNQLVTIIEWISFLEKEYWPEDAFCLEWSNQRDGRTLSIYAIGSLARPLLESHAPKFSNYMMETDLT